MGNAMDKHVVRGTDLHFHAAVRGANVRLDERGTRATRRKGFCGGLALSSRPVRPCERVHVRLGPRDSEWQGALRVGFTSRDPDTMALPLPPYALPDLVDQRGSWADRVPEELAVQGAEIAFWVQADGSMFCSAWLPGSSRRRGRARVWRLKGRVEARLPLWAVVDVYGTTRDVQLLGTTVQPPVCSGRSSERVTLPIAPLALRTPPPSPPSPPPLSPPSPPPSPPPPPRRRDVSVCDACAPVGTECVVCMHGPRQAAFIPCGHYCVCEVCATLLCECPLCRRPCENVIRIYCS
ncbi:unnamed protein product [Lampetra fluviatilis]